MASPILSRYSITMHRIGARRCSSQRNITYHITTKPVTLQRNLPHTATQLSTEQHLILPSTASHRNSPSVTQSKLIVEAPTRLQFHQFFTLFTSPTLTFGAIQGTFRVIQGTVGVIQRTFGVI
jgi:hypothetical protein